MPSFIGFAGLWNRSVDGPIPLDGDDDKAVVVYDVEDLLSASHKTQLQDMLDLDVSCTPSDMVEKYTTALLLVYEHAHNLSMR